MNSNFLPIGTAPKDESSFLIVRPRADGDGLYVEEASFFEGFFYPERLGCLVDYSDAILDAVGWLPLPERADE
jgi:hypothetical protein